MERAEAFLEMRRRAVKDADLLQVDAQRVRRDLRHHGLEALADARGADEHRYAAVIVERDAGVLARAGRAALHEAAHGDAVVAAVDELPLLFQLFFPVKFFKALLERL